MPVCELQQRIDAREYAEWKAFYDLNPFGLERGDLHAGIVASTLANAWRGKGSNAAKPSDFMPNFLVQTKRQTSEEIRDKLIAYARLHNAAIGSK